MGFWTDFGIAYATGLVLLACHVGRLALLDRRDQRRADRDQHPSRRPWTELAQFEAQLADIDADAIARAYE